MVVLTEFQHTSCPAKKKKKQNKNRKSSIIHCTNLLLLLQYVLWYWISVNGIQLGLLSINTYIDMSKNCTNIVNMISMTGIFLNISIWKNYFNKIPNTPYIQRSLKATYYLRVYSLFLSYQNFFNLLVSKTIKYSTHDYHQCHHHNIWHCRFSVLWFIPVFLLHIYLLSHPS